MDETAWRVGASSAWLWVAATEDATAYNVAHGRGFDQACDLVRQDYEKLAEEAHPHDENRKLIKDLYNEREAIVAFLTHPGVDAKGTWLPCARRRRWLESLMSATNATSFCPRASRRQQPSPLDIPPTCSPSPVWIPFCRATLKGRSKNGKSPTVSTRPACGIMIIVPSKSPSKPVKQSKSEMTVEHKKALAVGRDESRAIRQYLEALEAHKPRRGRRRTVEGMQARIERIDDELLDADPLSKVHLAQERINLYAELASRQAAVDLGALEDEFVRAAAGYSERKGISYTAWRDAGVEAEVLRRAGIPRTHT